MKKSYKKYLRQLILENVENVSFKKLQRVNEPDRICSETEEEHVNKVRQKILETFSKHPKSFKRNKNISQSGDLMVLSSIHFLPNFFVISSLLRYL